MLTRNTLNKICIVTKYHQTFQKNKKKSKKNPKTVLRIIIKHIIYYRIRYSLFTKRDTTRSSSITNSYNFFVNKIWYRGMAEALHPPWYHFKRFKRWRKEAKHSKARNRRTSENVWNVFTFIVCYSSSETNKRNKYREQRRWIAAVGSRIWSPLAISRKSFSYLDRYPQVMCVYIGIHINLRSVLCHLVQAL